MTGNTSDALIMERQLPGSFYGEPEEVAANTTIIFCGVHGDEITPVKFCFDIMTYLDDLKEFPEELALWLHPL